MNDNLNDGQCSNHLVAFTFSSIKQVMKAGEILKNNKIEVLVMPKRNSDCGAYLLFPKLLKTKVIELLVKHGIKSEELKDEGGDSYED